MLSQRAVRVAVGLASTPRGLSQLWEVLVVSPTPRAQWPVGPLGGVCLELGAHLRESLLGPPGFLP